MDFLDYLDSHFDVKHVGSSQVKLSGQCPFCGEEREDLRVYVNTATGLGICFHCGVGFNPIKFVAAHCGKGYKSALAILNDDDDYAKTKDDAVEGHGLPWPELLGVEDGDFASEYLNGRGIGRALVEHFKIMRCDRNMLVGDRVYYTNGHVVMPIHDITGKAISWQGRDATGKARSRYVFPPGFKGAEYLYNAWSIAERPEYLIIGEGVFDVFGWWRAGFKNVVATFGKKISEAQVDILRYLKPKVIFIAWDSDAHWKKYEFFEKKSHLFNIRIVDLCGKDADECSSGELKKFIGEAKKYSWGDKIIGELALSSKTFF